MEETTYGVVLGFLISESKGLFNKIHESRKTKKLRRKLDELLERKCKEYPEYPHHFVSEVEEHHICLIGVKDGLLNKQSDTEFYISKCKCCQ